MSTTSGGLRKPVTRQPTSEEDANTKPADVAVLFSGGRDSSLTICELAESGRVILPVTVDTGVYIGAEISEYRYQELRNRFPSQILCRRIVPAMGLFRKVALRDIEDDFRACSYNLIVLGAQLAIHTVALQVCRDEQVKLLASGFTSYQSAYAEQMPAAIVEFKKFSLEFGIAYSTPVYHRTTADDVKYSLLDFGISTKSLEGTSVFADTFSDPDEISVLKYIERKLVTCRQYLEQHPTRSPLL